ncbi:hypothetical protein [Pseudomonas sp. MWU12-2037]|uniref:hypothetical protein n=1 Tax=Pseudomonas sp. MWU12-2037 TaxID=2928690 RepID=UPI00200FC790|nr:hypothetical protein [Pseudomonas sp. MWU12-2037]
MAPAKQTPSLIKIPLWRRVMFPAATAICRRGKALLPGLGDQTLGGYLQLIIGLNAPGVIWYKRSFFLALVALWWSVLSDVVHDVVLEARCCIGDFWAFILTPAIFFCMLVAVTGLVLSPFLALSWLFIPVYFWWLVVSIQPLDFQMVALAGSIGSLALIGITQIGILAAGLLFRVMPIEVESRALTRQFLRVG